MTGPFSQEDEGKNVVTANGQRFGTIRDVDDDGATVDRDEDDADLTDEIKDFLDWGDDDEANRIRDHHVDESTEDEVRLRQY